MHPQRFGFGVCVEFMDISRCVLAYRWKKLKSKLIEKLREIVGTVHSESIRWNCIR